MIVRGRFRDGVPYFGAWISFAGMERFVWLLADTGAARSTLLDHDVRRLQIPAALLIRAEQPMAGIGGSVPAFIFRDARISLESDEDDVAFPLDLLVACHDLQNLPPAAAERILKLPSVMGRDILNRFRFVYEHATGTVLLEG